MPSRRKRKRQRRQAEATASAPAILGGWGNDAPVSPSDMLLVRQAIREGWPVPERVASAVIRDICDVALAANARHSNAAVRVILAMEADNIKAEQSLPREPWPTGAPLQELA